MEGSFNYLAEVDPQLPRLRNLADAFHDGAPTSIGKMRLLAKRLGVGVALVYRVLADEKARDPRPYLPKALGGRA
jgi:hypothetical protein